MDGYVSQHEVMALVQLSRSTIWRLERQGLFPARRHLSRRRVGWRKSEIEGWLDSRDSMKGEESVNA
jgi:prophage regulatory protein